MNVSHKEKYKSTGLRLCGLYSVKEVLLSELSRNIVKGITSRIILSRKCNHAYLKNLEGLLLSFPEEDRPEIVVLTLGELKGVRRNVPKFNKLEEGIDSSKLGILVEKNADYSSEGRVLVLGNQSHASFSNAETFIVGLKYRGNVGTIIRSAVQANMFKCICIIDDTDLSRKRDYQWANSAKQDHVVSEEEINYYSLQNAPLVKLLRYKSLNEFMPYMHEYASSKTVASLEISPEALNLYSMEAVQVLNKRDLVLILGAEDMGIPEQLLKCSKTLLEIPTMSASINVSCAFTAVLSIIQITEALFAK